MRQLKQIILELLLRRKLNTVNQNVCNEIGDAET